MTNQDTDILPIGARIKMSELGAVRCPRLADKIGTVIGASSRYYGSITVRFDGNKTATALHRDYIAPMHPPSLSARARRER
jgi:hypothetical protein